MKRTNSSPRSSPGAALDTKPPMCLSPQEKLKGAGSKTASLSGLVHRKTQAATISGASSLLAMDIDMADLDDDLDLALLDDADDDHHHGHHDDGDHVMDDAGWISDDNLRALEFDERLNQEIDWVAHDDVEGSLKLQFVPAPDEEQDFAFDSSSFLSPLRSSLSSFEVASSFAESLSVDTPPPSFGTSHDAEKLLMSFDTMNFTIPSPTSGSTKKRTSLFGKSDDKPVDAGATAAANKGSMSPSLKTKAGAAAVSANKDSPLPKLAIPANEQLLGVLSITTPTAGATTVVDPQKKIGSYSPEARRLRIAKFHEKRKNRTWKKSIKYDCRKKLADDRPRIKGRFVRVLENTPDAAAKEEDASSTASTASTGSSSPRSVASPSPSTASTCDTASASPASVSAVQLTTAAPVLQASPAFNPVMQAVASVLAAAASASSLSSTVSQTPAAPKLTVVAPVPVIAPVAPSIATTDATAAAQ